jgi:hypothetical protein
MAEIWYTFRVGTDGSWKRILAKISVSAVQR